MKKKKMLSDFRPDKYFVPFTSFGFKTLFGTESNKELLISFVNSILEGKEVVKDLSYVTDGPFGSPKVDRGIVIIASCVNEHGEKILVELQRGTMELFKEKIVYFTSAPVFQPTKSSEQIPRFKAVYVVAALNFDFYDQVNDYFHHEVEPIDIYSDEEFCDKLNFVYLELPKFKKTEDQLETLLDKWLFVLRDMTRIYDRPAALQERVFSCLFESAEISKLTEKQSEEYESSLKVYRDWKSCIETAMKRGREEGLKQARVKKKKEITSLLSSYGMSEDFIVEFFKIFHPELLNL